MFELARGYGERGDDAPTCGLQEREFELEDDGYTATRHQREVGAGYFDQVLETITGGTSSTLALKGSTEEAQFATRHDRREQRRGAADRRSSSVDPIEDERRPHRAGAVASSTTSSATFGARRRELLARRAERLERLHARRAARLPPRDRGVRAGDWRVAPDAGRDRRPPRRDHRARSTARW